MLYHAIKILVSIVVITLVVEISKRSSMVGAVMVSIPVVSILSITWLYMDTGDVIRVETLSRNVFWMILPALMLFVCLPWLLEAGMSFWISLLISMVATCVAYGMTLWVLTAVGGR